MNKISFKVGNLCWGLLLLSCVYSCNKPIPESPPNDEATLTDTTILNNQYGAQPIQVYDIFLPAERDSNTAIILMIHGGAWKAGNKEALNPYVNLIKKNWKGVAIVNMNYRLASNSNNIHHGEMMDDISAVITDVLNNKEKYHVSSKMGIMGASAGGQLAMIYAYKYNAHKNIKCVGNFFGPSIINDWAWYNSINLWLGGKVGSILAEYVGLPWDTTAYKAVSPYWNVSSESQPTILFHGNLDPIVPVYQSKWMYGKLNQLGVPSQYHEYIAFHGFNSTQSGDAIKKMVDFFKIYLE